MKKRLVIYLDFRVAAFTATAKQVAWLQAQCPELEVIHCLTQEDFVRNLSKADFIYCYQFAQFWFPLTYRAKWLATPAAGKELLGCTPPSRMRVTYGRFHGEIMAESTLAMILAVNRGLLPGMALTSEQSPWPEAYPHFKTLQGSHAVIVGFGGIGQAIARLLTPFGVRITPIRSTTIDQLDEALTTADHVILALPKSPTTDNLMDAARLAKMPKSTSLYNVGRGNAIDEVALAQALESGTLHAACLDVLKQEPYPVDGRLRQAPHCYLYPHCSAIAPHYLNLAFAEWVADYHASPDYTPEK